MRIAIGPVNGAGSWDYFSQLGHEIAKQPEVSRVVFFSKNEKARADVCLTIKHLKYDRSVTAKHYVYVPVDRYQEQCDLTRGLSLRYGLIIVNCSRLVYFFPQMINQETGKARNCVFIPHTIAYAATNQKTYKEPKNILWVGSYHYVKTLRKWWDLGHFPENCNLICLSNKNIEPWAENIKADIWSRKLYMYWLTNADAALDTKDDGLFWHRTKPLTKPCEYIASGLPTALTSEVAQEEFKTVFGMFVPLADGKASYWYSQEYFTLTQLYGNEIKKRCLPENAAKEYLKCINTLMT